MKNNKIYRFGLFIFKLVLIFVIFIVFYMSIVTIQEKLFANGDYITVMIKSPYSYLVYLVLVLFLSSIEEINLIKGKKKFKYILPMAIILLYIAITSVTVITEEGIYDYSFYNLKGNEYSFSQVENVTTGFKDSGKNKGEFYYNIEIENGKTLKLAYPSMINPSPEYDEDTWKEYIDIDKYIMNSGAKKKSSESGKKYVSMDKVYIDKLLWVINNK